MLENFRTLFFNSTEITETMKKILSEPGTYHAFCNRFEGDSSSALTLVTLINDERAGQKIISKVFLNIEDLQKYLAYSNNRPATVVAVDTWSQISVDELIPSKKISTQLKHVERTLTRGRQIQLQLINDDAEELARITYLIEAHTHDLHIDRLDVFPGFRYLGLGTQLLEHLMQTALLSGVEFIKFEIDRDEQQYSQKLPDPTPFYQKFFDNYQLKLKIRGSAFNRTCYHVKVLPQLCHKHLEKLARLDTVSPEMVLLASRLGRVDMLESFEKNSRNINWDEICDFDNASLFHVAPDLATFNFLATKMPLASFKQRKSDGYSPLHCKFTNRNIPQDLIAAYCEYAIVCGGMSQRTHDGETPLMIAAGIGSEATLEVLLKSQYLKSVMLEAVNKRGQTAAEKIFSSAKIWYLLSLSDKEEIMKKLHFLREAGANLKKIIKHPETFNDITIEQFFEDRTRFAKLFDNLSKSSPLPALPPSKKLEREKRAVQNLLDGELGFLSEADKKIKKEKTETTMPTSGLHDDLRDLEFFFR